MPAPLEHFAKITKSQMEMRCLVLVLLNFLQIPINYSY